MEGKLRRTIAKEIVDQTLSHFKKQKQLDATREESSISKVERRSEESYDPSTNFNRVFSGIIGEKSQIEKKKVESESKIKSPSEIDSRKVMHDEPVYHEQQQEEEATPNSHMENKRDELTTTVSVFKKLSLGAKNG